jgi:ribosomal-protein-alanine N-acetyltransferase
VTIDVRVARASDIDELTALDVACFTRAWTRQAWVEELARGGVLVGGRPLLALACAAVLADICELRRIAVHPSMRRAGMERDLLRAVIDHARHSGCTRVELEVAASNEPALGLYRAHGFEVVGRRRGYYREPLDDALLMTLDLSTSNRV